MDHNEAIEMMASERYLLDELTPELRDAYEEHFFCCEACASDITLGAAFVDQAKVLLPSMAVSTPRTESRTVAKVTPFKRDWISWFRPIFLVPISACLLAIIGYQNFVTVPALEVAANEPHILPAPTVLHGVTRSGRAVVSADSAQGSSITLALPESTQYASFRFDLRNSAGKVIWAHTRPATPSAEDTITLWLPPTVEPGSYTLNTSATTLSGETFPFDQQAFDLQQIR